MRLRATNYSRDIIAVERLTPDSRSSSETSVFAHICSCSPSPFLNLAEVVDTVGRTVLKFVVKEADDGFKLVGFAS
jgi:hypothetical protein